MPYAEGRIYNDADAYVMEPASWLDNYADPKTRALLKPIDFRAREQDTITRRPLGQRSIFLLPWQQRPSASRCCVLGDSPTKWRTVAIHLSQPWTPEPRRPVLPPSTT